MLYKIIKLIYDNNNTNAEGLLKLAQYQMSRDLNMAEMFETIPESAFKVHRFCCYNGLMGCWVIG